MTINITYKQAKEFTKDQVANLFHSVNWISANYPNRLFKALQNSSTVITAWHEDELVGLVRVIDDTQMVAFIHYVLVNPKYQGLGIASKMLNMVKEKYQDFLYIDVMPEDRNNVPFYEKLGFEEVKTGSSLNICNYDIQD